MFDVDTRNGSEPGEEIIVTNPFNSDVVGRVRAVSPAVIGDVLARAERGRIIARGLSRHTRADILSQAAALILERSEVVAQLIVDEAGKTIGQARQEALRAANTLQLSAIEATRNAGEIVPFDSYAGSENRQGWFTREPLGIIAAITPFNDPLNIVAHKLGPAIAGGNAVILKPSELTPLSAERLVEILIEAGLPPEVITVVNGAAELGQAIVSAREIRMISFTGGFAAGETIAKTAGLKRLAMDLGGNAPVIVFDDAKLSLAVERCVSGAFGAAGQNCIGTQRILVQKAIYDEFRVAFIAATRMLKTGNPSDAMTDVGPMITEASARTAKRKVDAAVDLGAIVLVGNYLEGSLYSPTVLENVPDQCELSRDEIFAPVVTLQAFDCFDDAIEIANQVDFSLHAGVFTTSLERATRASNLIDAGGIMINDSSDYRFDGMPFGGFTYGSMGREGVRFAYEEMTQPKVVCISN